MLLNIDTKKNIIKKVISNQDYRDDVLVIIDEKFFLIKVDDLNFYFNVSTIEYKF